MVRICVCLTYADAIHIDMVSLYLIRYFSAEIRKKVKPDRINLCSRKDLPGGVNNSGINET